MIIFDLFFMFGRPRPVATHLKNWPFFNTDPGEGGLPASRRFNVFTQLCSDCQGCIMYRQIRHVFQIKKWKCHALKCQKCSEAKFLCFVKKKLPFDFLYQAIPRIWVTKGQIGCDINSTFISLKPLTNGFCEF